MAAPRSGDDRPSRDDRRAGKRRAVAVPSKASAVLDVSSSFLRVQVE